MDIQLLQEIITYIIIAVAVYIAGYKILIALGVIKDSKDACGTDCSGCSPIDMKKRHSGSSITER